MIRTAWVAVVALGATVYIWGRTFLEALLGLDDLIERQKATSPRRWASAIFKATGCTVSLEGAQHLHRDRPQIIVANHASWFDVLALATVLPVPIRFVAKEELARVPLFGPTWQKLGHIAIDRDDHSSAVDSLEKAARVVQEEGATVIMFPEGTRSPTGELRRFKKGAFVLAIKAAVPVVPVAVVGTWNVMPKGSWTVTPGDLVVRVGEPLDTESLTLKDRDALRDQAWIAVAELLGKDRSLPDHPPARGDPPPGAAREGPVEQSPTTPRHPEE